MALTVDKWDCEHMEYDESWDGEEEIQYFMCTHPDRTSGVCDPPEDCPRLKPKGSRAGGRRGGGEREGGAVTQYGPQWRRMNRWVKPVAGLLRCEACGGSPITLHHIAPSYTRHWPECQAKADEPRFWMLLCDTCHWYACRCETQPFQIERLHELAPHVFKGATQ